MMLAKVFFEFNVEFEDIKFLRATTMSKDVEVVLTIIIQPGTGYFEISEGNTAVVSGFVRQVEACSSTEINFVEKPDLPILLTKDFYKELRLRGYHYSGLFRSVTEARCDGLQGKVRWDGNWVAYLDCLLQIQILARDTRSLCLPTGIQKLSIDVVEHSKYFKCIMGQIMEYIYDVKIDSDQNILKCGGVEIVNLMANVVGRRKPPGIPVLESYQFVPNFGYDKYSVGDGIRICVQIALENINTVKVKAVEVDTQNQDPIIEHMQEVVADLPMVTSELIVLSKRDMKLRDIQIEDSPLSAQANCLFVIASGVLCNRDFLLGAKKSLNDMAFVISREKSVEAHEKLEIPIGYHLICCIRVDEEVLVLLRYAKKEMKFNEMAINVSNVDQSYDWLEELKSEIKGGSTTLYAQNEKLSGLIGLTNCIRKEPEGHDVRCVYIDDDTAPEFDLQNNFYRTQLNLGLGINVYKNGNWGTYRHLQLKQNIDTKPTAKHCYINALTKSDLSSLKWIEGPYNYSKPKGELVKIQYASLNFRDVMLATGKLSADVVAESRLEHECVLGFEFSGVTASGRRVMGMTVTAAMVSPMISNNLLIYKINIFSIGN
jgi:fatty acid synthase